MTDFRVVIPARIGSTRLPGKVLRQLAGRTMLAHVFDRAQESGAREVIIATDGEEVSAAAHEIGANSCMTNPGHASGTDRINEVAGRLGWDDDAIVVNLQGDEPCMPPALIRQVAELLDQHADADIATLCHRIEAYEDWVNPNLVKVVCDVEGRALYFSRAPIPHDRENRESLPAAGAYGHLGIYAYRVGALRRFSSLPASTLETCEALEQLRALENSMCIYVSEAIEVPGPGVDTEEDLQAAEKCLLSDFS